MARWDKIGSKGKISDRRGTRAAGLGGGATLIGIVAFFGLQYLGINVDPSTINQVISQTQSTSQEQSAEFAGEDNYERFASAVLGSTNDYWSATLPDVNATYTEPTLVLFRDATRSGCGTATTQVGPHYCPPDSTIYLDERFFEVLVDKLGAKGGDTAQAYVIAHEVGHHVQNVIGTMDKVQSDPDYRKTGDNSLSVRLELQADCYAGLWANSLRDQDIFEKGDIDEAIDAAGAVGDDRIQQNTQGSINPETWTHGSSKARKGSFTKGYESGKISQCSL